MRLLLKGNRNFVLVAVLAVFVSVCFLLQYTPFMEKARNALQVNHVPSELLSYNKLGEMFHRLGLIHVIPNDSERYRQEYDQKRGDGLGPFQKRRQVSDTLITPGKPPDMMQEAVTQLKNGSTGEEVTVISVVTKPENIRGEYGILTNYRNHGRNWERLAYMALAQGGELLENDAAGIRLHGGTSRDPSLEKHSYRLYFRKVYGTRRLPTAEIFEELESLRTLVVHVDIPKEWPLNNVIANRVYDMIGVPTIEYSQAEFILNGENQGLYWLSPHLSEKYIKEKYKLRKIHYQRYRGQEKNQQYRDDIGRLESEEFTPLTYDKLARYIDADGMIDYFIAVTYSGNTDWNQGVGFKDAENEESRWRWIAWDLDHSFVDWYVAGSRNPNRQVWQQDGLGLIFNARLHKIKSKRQRLFRRLLVEDPAFKDRFVARYIDVLNHRLRVDKLLTLYDEYEQIIAAYDRKINPQLHGFFKNRHAHMRWELQQYFKLPPFLPLTIKAEGNMSVKINGHEEKLPYTGHYLTETAIKLELPESGDVPAYHIKMNGRDVSASRTRFSLAEPTEIVLTRKD